MRRISTTTNKETLKMNFDATYQGKVMQGTNLPIYSIRADGAFAAAWAEKGTERVALTGYTATSPRGNLHYQTTLGGWIFIPDGWAQVGVVSVARYSQSQAQALVNTIIKNNKQIISNNLLCARYASKLTETQRAQVRELQNRLQARNGALQAEGLTTNVQTSYPAGYAELSEYLDALMAGETIGIATWVVVVIAATVIAATATAAYFAYKSLADESERDVKYSKELTRILTSKLTSEEYEQLKAETKGIVTKARIKQTLSNGWGAIKTLLIGGVFSYIAYKSAKFYNNRNK